MFTTHPCLTICATTPDISRRSPVRDTFMVLARGLGNDSAHGHGHVPKHTAATWWTYEQCHDRQVGGRARTCEAHMMHLIKQSVTG
jgi:hypothetical protein